MVSKQNKWKRDYFMAKHVKDETGMAQMVAMLAKVQPTVIYGALRHDLGTHPPSKQLKSKYTVLNYAVPSPPLPTKANPPFQSMVVCDSHPPPMQNWPRP